MKKMAVYIDKLNGGNITVNLGDANNWKFSLGDFPETIEFSQFPGSNSNFYTQICPSQDETRLLVAFGGSYKVHAGTWIDFDPSTYQKTAESANIKAGSTLYTPDGIHYLTQNFNTSAIYMYEGTVAYDVTTISSQQSSSKAIQGFSNINGSGISVDGRHLVCYAGNTLLSFDLSTPFDLSTMQDQKQHNVGFPATEIFVNQANGRQILCVNTSSNASGGTMMLISLDSAWDASSVSNVDFASPNVLIGGVTYTSERFLRGVAVNNEGNKVVLIGSSMDKTDQSPDRSKAYAALVDFS